MKKPLVAGPSPAEQRRVALAPRPAPRRDRRPAAAARSRRRGSPTARRALGVLGEQRVAEPRHRLRSRRGSPARRAGTGSASPIASRASSTRCGPRCALADAAQVLLDRLAMAGQARAVRPRPSRLGLASGGLAREATVRDRRPPRRRSAAAGPGRRSGPDRRRPRRAARSRSRRPDGARPPRPRAMNRTDAVEAVVVRDGQRRSGPARRPARPARPAAEAPSRNEKLVWRGARRRRCIGHDGSTPFGIGRARG